MIRIMLPSEDLRRYRSEMLSMLASLWARGSRLVTLVNISVPPEFQHFDAPQRVASLPISLLAACVKNEQQR